MRHVVFYVCKERKKEERQGVCLFGATVKKNVVKQYDDLRERDTLCSYIGLILSKDATSVSHIAD